MQCPPSDVAPPVDLETDLAQARGQGPGPQRDDAQHADHQEDRGFHGDAPYHSDLERGHRQPDGHEESLEREGKRQIQRKDHESQHHAHRTPHERLASNELQHLPQVTRRRQPPD